MKSNTIGLITPSSPMRSGRLESGLCYLKQKGFQVKLGRHIQDADRFLAGKDVDRASDIMDFFKDPEVSVIMATGGGYGSQRLLPLLDFDIIRANPKPIVGFSDTTALQLGLVKKANLISYTGFVFRDLDSGLIDPLIDQTLMNCLLKKDYSITEGSSVNAGIVQGKLIGANLSLTTALMGTPYQPNFEDAILLIEEVFSEPYVVDCMLSQLELAGVFNQVKGVIFGEFEQCIAKHFPERDGTVDEVINEWSTRIRVPCIKNFPYGHGDRRCVLPLGKKVTLNATEASVVVKWDK